jgi:dynein heavy chain
MTERSGSAERKPMLWEQAPDAVIAKMKSSIRLCEEYKAHYKETKARLAQMQKGKQFEFDETIIFGKFTRFRRRLEKLIDMFSSIKQFRALDAKRVDGLEPLIRQFDALITDFKMKVRPC